MMTPSPPPSRTCSEVDARGRQILRQLGDKKLAERGFLNVSAAPYHADPTGTKDATAALQRALNDARDARLVTFLPSGRYLLSDTLEGIQGTVNWDQWPYGKADAMVENRSYNYPCTLLGSTEGEGVTLVLTDRSPGFDDAGLPKPLIHFWSRNETPNDGGPGFDPTRPQPNISFNQQIANLSIDLGDNAGAVAVRHQGAQMSVIENIHIDASRAFAGLHCLPGSGGGTHGISVTGGRYGLYVRSERQTRGSQPVPVVSDLRLSDQTEAAVLFDGRGPLTLVGARLEGAGIVVEAPSECPFNGPLNVVDSRIRINSAIPAIQSSHAVVLENVEFEGAETLVSIDRTIKLRSPHGQRAVVVSRWGGGGRIFSNGTSEPTTTISLSPNEYESTSQHSLNSAAVDFEHAVDVRQPPYNAKGDGQTDDTAALQKALDSNPTVFLPKGVYAISRPLVLHAESRLIGAGPVFSTLVALESAHAFRDPLHPAPLVDTEDSPTATTSIARLEIRVPVNLAGAYALRWRAGRRSVVRNVNFERTLWDPDSPGLFHPFVRIEGGGGGRWYQTHFTHWWSQGIPYRHLLINGTREPLTFYMLNPEHARCTVQVEVRQSQDISIFAMKGEGNYPVIRFVECDQVRLFGYGGNGSPWPGWAAIEFESCRQVVAANLAPHTRDYVPGRWTGLGIGTGRTGWHLLKDERQHFGAEPPIVLYEA